MKTKFAVLSCTGIAAALLISSANSKDDGYMPSGTGSSTSQTRNGSNSCGRCHGGLSSLTGTKVSVVPSARVLATGQTISIKVSASAPVSSNTGGFAADISRGTLIAGTNSKVRSDALAITHRNDKTRSWTFNYRASTTPGLVEFYTVAMASDGDGRADRDDLYGFHGFNTSSTVSTPVRFYVNAPAVKAIGMSCDDGYGNYSVLGSPTTPTIGKSLKLEARGLPPSSQALFMLGVGKTNPGFDLKALGAAGCFLYANAQLELMLPTTGGNASRSEGMINLSTMIPNDSKLKGLVVNAQILALDKKPKRAFPVVATNAIEMTIQ